MMPRLFLTLLVLLAGLMPAWASDPLKAVPEYTMKAAYLYNFAQLTTWPEKPQGREESFTLCVYGESELEPFLMALDGRMVNRQPLRFLRVSEAAEVRQCNMLYIGEHRAEAAGRLVESLQGTPVLTVTDTQRLGRSGIMLVIVSEGKRLSFDINVNSALRSQLKFSSKLLNLARKVGRE